MQVNVGPDVGIQRTGARRGRFEVGDGFLGMVRLKGSSQLTPARHADPRVNVAHGVGSDQPCFGQHLQKRVDDAQSVRYVTHRSPLGVIDQPLQK